MDKNSKLKIAKAIVAVDDAINESKGISDLLGKVIATAIGSFFNADIPVNKGSEPESKTDSE